MSTINFPARLVELTVTSCDIIVIPRVRWGGLVNYFDVNWGGRNLLLSETDQKIPLPTRVTAPPFAVPHKMVHTLRRNVELYIGAGQFYHVIRKSQLSDPPGGPAADHQTVSGTVSDVSLCDADSLAWPLQWTL